MSTSTSPIDPVLPEQMPDSLQAKIAQVQQQQALLAQWRATGDPQLMHEANTLQAQYHVRDVGALAKDVYRSAAHEAASPGLGWIRVSEHPEMLQHMGVKWSKDQILDYLQPLHSDFRAEIYLPDPRVYGPEVKPVVVYKGSNGPVAVPDGKGGTLLRESALEDWIENGRQGIGLESDHYDRSMRLAADLKRNIDRPFELAGHSKGGGQAAAAAAITGMTTHTFNSSSLHPNTARRYAEQHGLTLYNVDPLVHGYHVQGEFLHDTLTGIHNMDGLTRAQMGLAARQFGELSQVADVRTVTQHYLAQALPYDSKMQQDAIGLVDYLASHSGSQVLKGVPLPSGTEQIELRAMMRDRGQLVDRPKQASLGETARDAGPLMNVVSGALTAGVMGKHAGDVVAMGGDGVELAARMQGAEAHALAQSAGHAAGSEAVLDGAIAGTQIHIAGAAVADIRLAKGMADAVIDQGLGKIAQWDSALVRAESHIPLMGHLMPLADIEAREATAYSERQQVQATRDMADAQRDAAVIRQVTDQGTVVVVQTAVATGQTIDSQAQQMGRAIDSGYAAAGEQVRKATDKAPVTGVAAGVVVGGTVTALGSMALSPGSTLIETGHVVEYGKDATVEAANRHAMEEVVLPSLDARTRQMEDAGITRMRERQHAREAPLQGTPAQDKQTQGKQAQNKQAANGMAPTSQEYHRKPPTLQENPSAFLDYILAAAKSGDRDAFRQATLEAANGEPARAMRASAVANVDRQELVASHQQQLDAFQQQMSQQQAQQQTHARSGPAR